MIVKFRFRRRDLDESGVLTTASLRGLAHHLRDCPATIRLVVDLGPCRQLQEQLIRELALYACAGSIRFVGSDWQAVRGHSRALALGSATTEAV